jgi:hypothetical protein
MHLSVSPGMYAQPRYVNMRSWRLNAAVAGGVTRGVKEVAEEVARE